jgi:hypothetical protein
MFNFVDYFLLMDFKLLIINYLFDISKKKCHCERSEAIFKFQQTAKLS